MNQGYFRVAAVAPAVSVAGTDANAEAIIQTAAVVAASGAELAVFPELSITAYTCGDLFHNSTLLNSARLALAKIITASASFPTMTMVVGMPLQANGMLFNCAVFLGAGRPVAVVPKTYLPNYNEFYEQRWFASGEKSGAMPSEVELCGFNVPFGTDIIVSVNGVKVAAEICEDLWSPLPPSSTLSLSGAEVIVNLSASDDLIGKYDYLVGLIKQQSARCVAGYVYSSAGFGESTTDMAFDAKCIIAENGNIIRHMPRWIRHPESTIADIDIYALRHDRMHSTTFSHAACRHGSDCRVVDARIVPAIPSEISLCRVVNPSPFVPPVDELLDSRCTEIVNIQTSGLAQRLKVTNTRSLVIGVSGGLDSTLALLVAVKAFDVLGIPRSGITAVTMPGFGTTGRTHSNATELMKVLGVTIREISIVPAVMQHFADIGHNPDVHDVTYENSQARQRTMLLMDIANQVSGMVLGTGDLSELALGWATYNGDHMSMYGVNAGVPKTLVKYLVKWFADRSTDNVERNTLLDIIDTPISPELIPANSDGTIAQVTEDLVGPYELHDFFLYYTLRYGFSPSRIFLLANTAFENTYDRATIKKWLTVFFRRFFSQQFKRSCMPDGPKVGSVCLSPRGDWRMPSDACSVRWIKECEDLKV